MTVYGGLRLNEEARLSRCLIEYLGDDAFKITLFDDSVFENVEIENPHEITRISGKYDDLIDTLIPERVKAKTQRSKPTTKEEVS